MAECGAAKILINAAGMLCTQSYLPVNFRSFLLFPSNATGCDLKLAGPRRTMTKERGERGDSVATGPRVFSNFPVY